jgi:hypothetical protein
MHAELGKYRNLGSASVLRGEQQAIFVFVDDAGNAGWTAADRDAVEKHVRSAIAWLEKEAARYGVSVQMAVAFAPPRTRLAQSVSFQVCETDLTAGPHHSIWQDQALTGLIGKAGTVGSLWDELFALHHPGLNAFRGRFMLFGVRRYFPSIAFPFSNGQHHKFEKERGIIYDEGNGGQWYLDSQIAHEILHLYGAIDLCSDKFPLGAQAFNTDFQQHVDPTGIMVKPTQRPIDEYTVDAFTGYLVGWAASPPAWVT